jgi:hypothetical protein
MLNKEFKLNTLEMTIVSISKFLNINIYLIYLFGFKSFRQLILFIKSRKSIIVLFKKILKKSKIPHHERKLIEELFFSYSESKSIDIFLLNSVIKKISRIDYSLDLSIIHLLLISTLLQSVGAFRLALHVEELSIKRLFYFSKGSIYELIFFVQLVSFKFLNSHRFIEEIGFTKIFPYNHYKAMELFWTETKTSKETDLFIGPLTNINEIIKHNKNLIIPNPSTETYRISVTNHVSKKIYFAIREPRMFRPLMKLKSILHDKVGFIIEEPSLLRQISLSKIYERFIVFKIKKNKQIYFNRYLLNYFVLNGLPYYLNSIILNWAIIRRKISFVGVNFFIENVNYLPYYVYGVKNIESLNINEKRQFILEMSKHNLISNYRMMKDLFSNNVIIPDISIANIMEISLEEYALKLETLYYQNE